MELRPWMADGAEEGLSDRWAIGRVDHCRESLGGCIRELLDGSLVLTVTF